ncbi:hypothetical protein GHT06_014986 [Daphnia sinensis]|uniref:PH domain-containing protein n=1 Tax=Daphnia sinensis TaxID=1820382 RepID=A0AAD5L9L8_9CRUS|nr:hypothetical protein GHT06_014986 [Daphnia sinensis]
MCEEENNKLCGYLQHKGKKRLISMWRRWYCVLNGRLLLFYRSESDYLKLGKFHERLDLGLVYDVLPALGVENGIQISTHTGPHWLRTTDEKSYELWLGALQASIVLRRQGSTLRKSKTGSSGPLEKVQSPVSNRNRKAKSTMSDVLFTTDERETTDKKIGSPFSRFSLGFIPGHGKKYSTYDGSRSYFRVEQSPNEEWDMKEKAEDDKKISETPKLRKKNTKQSRPLSESVSNFLLLNSQSSEKLTETKTEPVKSVNKKKNLPSIPKLPTSFGVGKLLSHLQTPSSGSSSRRHSKSMTSLVDACLTVDYKQQKSVSQSNVENVDEKETLFSKSEDILSKRASDTIRVDCENIVDDVVDKKDVAPDQTDCTKEPEENQQEVKVIVVSSEQQSSACAEDNEDPESPDDKKKGGKKTKDATRRKSGLAMLKQFFLSAKISMKRKGESVDKDKLCVNERSRKSSNESAAASEKSSARTSLTLESDQQHITVQNDVITEEQKQHQSKEETHEEEQSTEVTESPVISVLQRNESRISEGERSVQEEAFVSENAYTYEAKIIEIVEPQSPGLVPPEYVEPTPSNPCQDTITVPIKSARNSSELTISLEKVRPARKSVISCENVTKEDLEVAELKPVLPLKTKVKCPSPGYDIPRNSPVSVPCFNDIVPAVNPEEVIGFSCVVADPDSTTDEEPEEQEKSEPSKSSDELKPDVPTGDCSVPMADRKSVRKLSPLIQIFDHGSNPKAPNATPMRRSLSKTKAFEKRISFAQAEIETVHEEMVQILAPDPLE